MVPKLGGGVFVFKDPVGKARKEKKKRKSGGATRGAGHSFLKQV
jgi:hypothetical protein